MDFSHFDQFSEHTWQFLRTELMFVERLKHYKSCLIMRDFDDRKVYGGRWNCQLTVMVWFSWEKGGWVGESSDEDSMVVYVAPAVLWTVKRKHSQLPSLLVLTGSRGRHPRPLSHTNLICLILRKVALTPPVAENSFIHNNKLRMVWVWEGAFQVLKKQTKKENQV